MERLIVDVTLFIAIVMILLVARSIMRYGKEMLECSQCEGKYSSAFIPSLRDGKNLCPRCAGRERKMISVCPRCHASSNVFIESLDAEYGKVCQTCIDDQQILLHGGGPGIGGLFE
ncbi:MAG: hypothetical protein AAB630_02125 [Patescibacteria group bacterium]